jgi:hypothetical protein
VGCERNEDVEVCVVMVEYDMAWDEGVGVLPCSPMIWVPRGKWRIAVFFFCYGMVGLTGHKVCNGTSTGGKYPIGRMLSLAKRGKIDICYDAIYSKVSRGLQS